MQNETEVKKVEEVAAAEDFNVTPEEFREKLRDRKWRLNNLYFIKDEKGNKILFQMNPVQEYLHDNLWFFNIIPKARQLGITTFFAILYLDQVLWSDNKTAGIIAHRLEDMKKIFKHKIKYAWDNLHPWLRAKIGEPNTDSAYEMSFPNGSNIFVSMSTRSGTVQFLHISEFGPICQKFPDKAEEIVTGAINSVHAGQMVSIESTAAGRDGYFYDFCMDAEKARKEGRELTPLDFKIFFFPWWIDKRYSLDNFDFALTAEEQQYFETLKTRYNIELTDGQKRWYAKKKKYNQAKIFEEYPSTLDEAFLANVEGAYYTREMNKVYLSRRIRLVPIDTLVPVDTWWDLGMNDDNVILFTQTIGGAIHFVDLYVNSGENLAHYVKVLQDKGYRYGHHILPHDVEVRDITIGKTRKTVLYELGLTSVRVAPKMNLQDGIERVRNLFPRFYFDEEHCQPLTDSLSAYRKEWDAKLGVFKDKPKHDKNSHIADAVRTGCLLWHEEMKTTDDDGYPLKEMEQSFFS